MFAGLLLAVTGCGKKAGKDELPAPVGSAGPPKIAVPQVDAAPERTAESGALTATGTLRAIAEAELSSKATGTLAAVLVDEGDTVKNGQTVFRIDGSSASQQVKQAKAQLVSAKVGLSGAELEYNRTKQLAKGGAVSSAALDQAKLDYEKAKAGVEQAETLVSSARDLASDTVVRSPISGVVAKKYKETGEGVSMAGSPVLLIQDISKLEIRVGLPETALRRVKPGEPMHVLVRALDRTVSTTVKRINPSVDPKTRMIEVIGELDNDKGELKAGLLAEVTFGPAEKKAAAAETKAPVAKGEP